MSRSMVRGVTSNRRASRAADTGRPDPRSRSTSAYSRSALFMAGSLPPGSDGHDPGAPDRPDLLDPAVRVEVEHIDPARAVLGRGDVPQQPAVLPVDGRGHLGEDHA